VLLVDEWLSSRMGNRCYDVVVSSRDELESAYTEAEPGSYLTARSPTELDDVPLPLLDTMLILESGHAWEEGRASARGTELGPHHAVDLGRLMAGHFANRWLREPAFKRSRVTAAYRDWGEGLPQRSKYVRGIWLDGELVVLAAVRSLSPNRLVVDPIVTDARMRSKGLASEVLHDALARIEKGITVEAVVSTANEASLRVFAKSGFRERGLKYIYGGPLVRGKAVESR